jgi:uncharacterized protein
MALFTGRSRELGRLRGLLDGRESRVVRVTGVRGGGKSALVRRAVSDYPALVHRCAPLPDAAIRAALSERVGAGVAGAGGSDGWPKLVEQIAALADGLTRPLVLVLDDAHRLAQARSRWLAPMLALLADRAASGAAPIHIVLVGQRDGLPEDEALAPRSGETLEVQPLPLRAATPLLPGTTPEDKLLAYGVFGGLPGVLTRLDRNVTVGTNVRHLVLSADGALADADAIWLERDLQTPARYNAILTALAPGETDWAAVHAGVPDLGRSGQVAPYLAKLTQLGLVTARRSLDADPSSRSTRYAIADPFLAFWYRFVPSIRYGIEAESESASYGRAVRPSLDDHLASVFPALCRQHMRFDALETLGANAREGGSLWGAGYELPVAGLLTSGAAYYGACVWVPDETGGTPLTEIERSMRETRFGFGRERRLRLVFTGRPAPQSLRREVVRTRDAALIDAGALVGG